MGISQILVALVDNINYDVVLDRNPHLIFTKDMKHTHTPGNELRSTTTLVLIARNYTNFMFNHLTVPGECTGTCPEDDSTNTVTHNMLRVPPILQEY